MTRAGRPFGKLRAGSRRQPAGRRRYGRTTFLLEMTIPAKSVRVDAMDEPRRSGDLAALVCLAMATVLVHVLTGHQYGFQRDELATLEDARHLAWGFVAYPPVTPFFGRLSLILFGTSLMGFRFFAAVAQAVALVFVGLMARELGGRRGAQLVAAAAGVPFALGGGALMQYVSFDYLCWVLTAYFVIRLLKSEDARWWAAIGTAIGLGMESKYTMGFFVIAIVAAVVVTPARKYFASKWLWVGVALSILIFLPNLIWQAQHHFVSLDFLKHIHTRDVGEGRADGFLIQQLKIDLAGNAAGAGRALFLFDGGCGTALSHAGMDVCGDTGFVRGRQGAVVLHGAGLSHAICGGGGVGRGMAGDGGARLGGACAPLAWWHCCVMRHCCSRLPCRRRR